MLSLTIASVCILSVCSDVGASEKLPNFITPCKRNPQLSLCLKNRLEDLRHYLAGGIIEFGVPPIDPLKIAQWYVSVADEEVGRYNGTLKDLQYIGLKDYEVVASDIDLDNLNFKLKLRFPYITLSTFMNADGYFFGYYIARDFKAYLDFSNVIFEFSAKGTFYTNGEKTYIRWEGNQANASFDKAHLDTEGFFENRQKVKAFHIHVNNYIEQGYPHYSRLIKNNIGGFLLEALNNIHKEYPVEILYPKD